MTDPMGLGRAAGEFEAMAARLRGRAEGISRALAEAGERSYQACSPRGEVRVEVDGRLRVAAVHVAPEAMRLAAADLCALFTETLNAGLRAAREGSHALLMEGLDPATRTTVATQMGELGGPDRPGRGA